MQSYTDYNFKTDKFSPILTPASFMPLFVGIASKERATLMNGIAQKHFMPGMPTVAYDNPTYSTTYWCGPCWLNTTYFAAKGLKDYGFSDTANTMRDTIFDRVYNHGDYIHENYNSTTGEGLYYPEFSWNCFCKRIYFKFLILTIDLLTLLLIVGKAKKVRTYS